MQAVFLEEGGLMSYVVQYKLRGVKITQTYAYRSIRKLYEAVKGSPVSRLISPEGVTLIWQGKVTRKGRSRRTAAMLSLMASSSETRVKGGSSRELQGQSSGLDA